MLTITKRRILYVCFSIVFLLGAVAILFVASGYRYHWSRRMIYRPGLLVAEVSPKPDSLFLDGKWKMGNSETVRFQGILPGLRVVRFEKDGYFPWEGTVTVQSGTATNLGELRLFPKNISHVLHERVSRVAFSNGAKAAVLTEDPPSLVLIDEATGMQSPLIDRVSGVVDDLFWTPSADAVILRKTENAVQTLVLVSTAGATTTLPITVFSSDTIRWSARQPDQIYLLRSGTLSAYSRLTGAIVVIATEVLDWVEHGDTLFFLLTNGDIATRPSPGNSQELFVVGHIENPGVPSFIEHTPPQILTILDRATNKLALIPLDGRRPLTTYSNVSVASWSPDLRYLVFGSTFELSLRTIELDAEPALLRRSSKPFDGGWWIQESPYLLVHQEDALLILDTRGQADPLVFATVGSDPPTVHIRANLDRIVVFTGGALRAFSL